MGKNTLKKRRLDYKLFSMMQELTEQKSAAYLILVRLSNKRINKGLDRVETTIFITWLDKLKELEDQSLKVFEEYNRERGELYD